MPSFPYLIPVKVYDKDNVAASNVSVTLRVERTGEQLYQTTASDGTCLFNLSNLTFEYEDGDYIELFADNGIVSEQGRHLKFKAVCNQPAAQIEKLDVQYTPT